MEFMEWLEKEVPWLYKKIIKWGNKKDAKEEK